MFFIQPIHIFSIPTLTPYRGGGVISGPLVFEFPAIEVQLRLQRY